MTEASRGSLLFPRRPTFDYFQQLANRLGSASMQQLQSRDFWTSFRPGLVELTRRSLLERCPDITEFPSLERFCELTLACFKRVWASGFARSRRDQAALRPHLDEEEEESEPGTFQPLRAAAPGTLNLPLLQDLARRASMQTASATDSLL